MIAINTEKTGSTEELPNGDAKCITSEKCDIRLEAYEQEQRDGGLETSYEILCGENMLVGKAFTMERDGKRLLDYVDSDVVLITGVHQESFKELLEDAESLVEVYRRYERLERDGKIVSQGQEGSRYVFPFYIVLPKGGVPFTTDEELVEAVAEVLSVLD